MTNSTDQIVKTLADSFFNWFNNDILPVCVVIFNLLVIIVGLVLNIVLLVTFRKRGLFNEPSTFFIFAMCILDFVAYALLLIPNVMAAIAGDWLLGQPVCEIHGAMFTALMLGQFYFLITLSIERTLKLVTSAEKYYDRFFDNEKGVRIIICVTAAVTTAVAFIPVTGAGEIQYDFYLHGCGLDYTEDTTFLIVHFILTLVMSFISFLVCYILIFNERRKAIVQNRLECFKKAIPPDQRKSESSVGNDPSLTTITEDEDVFDGPSSDQDKIVKTPESSERRNTIARRRSRPKSSPRQSMMFEVFSDDEENPAFHLAVTYLFLWSAIMLCYFPYFVAYFYDAFNSGSIAGGIYTVAVLITHTSFVAKPIIYLGHNRHYREVTKATVPQSIRRASRSVRNSVSSISSKVEDFVFKSAKNKRFMATIAAHKAVLVWKKKMTPKKTSDKLNLTKPGVGGTVDKSDSSDVVPKSILLNKDNDALVVDAESQPISPKAPTHDGIAIPSLGRHSTITPSAIEVAPASSYIEKERQRLAAVHNNTVQSANANSVSPSLQVTSLHVSDDEADRSVPGVVDDRDMGPSPTHVKAW